MPINKPQMVRTATGNIRDLPSFCRNFIIRKILPCTRGGGGGRPIVQAVERRCWSPSRSHLRNNIVTHFTEKSYRFFEKICFICVYCLNMGIKLLEPIFIQSFAADTSFRRKRTAAFRAAGKRRCHG